jgi:hypothetical protein
MQTVVFVVFVKSLTFAIYKIEGLLIAWDRGSPLHARFLQLAEGLHAKGELWNRNIMNMKEVTYCA